MGNWTSTNKSTPATTVDTAIFKEEKAPNSGVAVRAVTQDATSQSTPVAQPKLKVAVTNSGGMRSQTALDAPLK
jgi:hypothetical protein